MQTVMAADEVYELTYTRAVNPNTSCPYILVASRLKNSRMAFWTIHIEEDRSGLLNLTIEQFDGWMAFTEIPDFFAMLSEPVTRKYGGQTLDWAAKEHTLDTIEAWLVSRAYKRFD